MLIYNPTLEFSDNRWNLNFISDTVYTELWITYISGDIYELRARSTKIVTEVTWTFGSTVLEGTSVLYDFLGPLPISITVNLTYADGSTETILYDPNLSRDTSVQGTILKVNLSQQTWRKADPITSIKTLDLLKEYHFTADALPQGLITMIKKPSDNDTFTFNGFIFTFTYSPTLPNHIQIDNTINNTLQNLINKINLLYDPRLLRDKLEFFREGVDLRYTSTERDYSLLNIGVSWTNNNFSGDGVIRGRWTTLEISTSTDPLIPVWNPITELPLLLEPTILYYISIRITRIDNLPEDWINIENIELGGTWEAPIWYGDTSIDLKYPGDKAILKPNAHYKVNCFTGFFVRAEGIKENRTLDIKFRYSFDNGRNFSNWLPLNKSNLEAIKPNPLGWFVIEYDVTRIGSDNSGIIRVHDIILEGDFFNIDCEYLKQNMLGISSWCAAFIKGEVNADGSSCTGENYNESGVWSTCKNATDCNEEFNLSLKQSCDDGTLWNPYKMDQVSKLYERRVDDVTAVLGRPVTYLKTSVDANGIDHLLHEHQLFERYDNKNIKIMVPDNEYPDPFLGGASFGMTIFETFKVHITKSEFKKAFGLTARPERNDTLYFCDTGLIYDVEQAQEARAVMNLSAYYEVHLVKHKDKANVKNTDENTKSLIEELTDTKNIEKVLESAHTIEIDKVLKVQEYKPQAEPNKMLVRYNNLKINEYILEIGSNIIAKYNYDIISSPINTYAVNYGQLDSNVPSGTNRAISLWFKPLDIIASERTILSNFESGQGWKIILKSRTIIVDYNGINYSVPSNLIQAGFWYALIVNLEQNTNAITISLWHPDSNSNLTRIAHKRFNNVITTGWEHNASLVIPGGNSFNITNIKLWKQVISNDNHRLILTENVSKDSQFIILADNADPILKLPNYGNNRNSYDTPNFDI